MQLLEDRESTILEYIIRDFIDTADPVSSKRVCKRSRLGLSPASIRNTMAQLDDEGYLVQPHTSGGRVPTDKAYRYFVDNLIGDRLVTVAVQTTSDPEEFLKKNAKKFGMFTVIAKSRHDLRSFGVDAVFHEPEFRDYEVTQAFAEILEGLGGIAEKYFEIGDVEPAVQIGRENPFDEFEYFSSVFALAKPRGKAEVVFSIGPKRRDYENTISIINYITNAIYDRQ